MRSEKAKSVHACSECGELFVGTPHSKYCPDCARIHRNAVTAKWRTQGPKRKLGSIDKCEACGKEYIVEGGKQRYCKACCDAEIVSNTKERKKKKYAENGPDKTNYPKTRVCPSCGLPFSLAGSKKYCSEECTEYGKYYHLALHGIKNGTRKSQPLPFKDWKAKRNQKGEKDG